MTVRPGSVRMPDFAGVALVDILANGVAMLIIFIVLSVATQIDRDQRFAERAEEVASVMSHKFSTSLVLNSLAASPPARLHDYDNSPLDQIFDPEILPILELHKGFVREFYSGAVWTRDALLDASNPLGQWVVGLNDFQRQRLRTDVYDVDQFYVTMSILREFGVTVNHWHFVPGRFALADARRCPPGMAAKDCASGAVGEARQALPEMAGGSQQGQERGRGGGPGGGDWPPGGSGEGSGGGGNTPGSMPEGTTPGMSGDLAGGGGGERRGDGSGGGGGSRSGGSGGGGGTQDGRRDGGLGRGFGDQDGSGGEVGFGSFPSANAGQGRAMGGRGSPGQRAQGSGREQSSPQIRFRMAMPESLREELGQAMDLGEMSQGSIEPVFVALFHVLGQFQDILDAGGVPTAQIAGFARLFTGALRSSPTIPDAQQEIASDLAGDFARMYRFGGPDSRYDPLAVYTEPPGVNESAVLLLETNRLIHRVGVARRSTLEDADAIAQFAQPTLNFNAHPDIWQGLNIPISLDSVVLMPPEAEQPEHFRWRAVAYIAPTLDDFIVGFVYARVDDEGRLRIQGDANQVRLGGRALFAETRESWFGARGWLVSLYAMLAVGLLLVLLARRGSARGESRDKAPDGGPDGSYAT